MLVSVFLVAVGVCFIVGLLLLISSLVHSNGHPIEEGDVRDISAFHLGLMCIIGSLVISPLSICEQVDLLTSYNEKVYDLVSIRRESGVEGERYLFHGYEDTKDYYKFYYKTNEEVMLGRVEAQRSRIIESGEVDPSIWKIKEIGEDYYYTIYVPLNTISQTFVLD